MEEISYIYPGLYMLYSHLAFIFIFSILMFFVVASSQVVDNSLVSDDIQFLCLLHLFIYCMFVSSIFRGEAKASFVCDTITETNWVFSGTNIFYWLLFYSQVFTSYRSGLGGAGSIKHVHMARENTWTASLGKLQAVYNAWLSWYTFQTSLNRSQLYSLYKQIYYFKAV